MDTETNLYEAISNILTTVQASSATHQKCLVKMKRLFINNNLHEFIEHFQSALTVVLKADLKMNKAIIERVMNFISSFCTSMEEVADSDQSIVESPFLRSVFNLLLQAQNKDLDVLRFRSCELISKLLKHMINYELSIDLYDDIQEAMLQRAIDCRAFIRQIAFTVLHSFQDPSNLECPVIKSLIKSLDGDPSAKVRCICVETVCLRKDVVQFVVEKTRDMDVHVRLAAYRRASNSPKHFHIIHKQTIIKNGFYDTSPIIKKFVQQKLIPMWLEKYEFNYLLFLKALRLDSNDKDVAESTLVVEYALQSLFTQGTLTELLKVLDLNENKTISLDDLGWETVLYWRILIQHIRKFPEYEATLQEILPELANFCKYIKEFCTTKKPTNLEEPDFEQIKYNFIIRQFFTITQGYDFGDNFGKDCLNSLIADILQNTILQADARELVIKNLNYSMPNIREQIKFLCELISEIMYENNDNVAEGTNTENDEFEIAQLKVKLNSANDEQSICIKESNFIRAEALKGEIDALQEMITNKRNTLEIAAIPQQQIKRTDNESLIKCLDIANALLVHPKVTGLSSMLKMLKDEFLQDLWMHPDDKIRSKAFKSMALCCVLDRKSAEVGIHIFCAQLEMYKNGIACDPETLKISIKAVIDLIRIFGPNLIAIPRDPNQTNPSSNSFDEQQESVFHGGSSLTTVVQGLVEFMQDDDTSIQELGGTGLCQFLLDDIIHSPTVISRLILKWCSPTFDEEDAEKLRQRIGNTLEELPLHRNSANQLQRAVVPTLRVLIRAPKHSPLASINIDNIIKVMLVLCQSSAEGVDIHKNLALQICAEIKEKPLSKCNNVLSKMLLKLVLPDNDQSLLDHLLGHCDDIRDEVSDRNVIRNITKFTTILNAKYITTNTLNTIEENVEANIDGEEKPDDENDINSEAEVPENNGSESE